MEHGEAPPWCNITTIKTVTKEGLGQTITKVGLSEFTEQLVNIYQRLQDMEIQVQQIADKLFGYEGGETSSPSKEADMPNFGNLLNYTSQAVNRLQNQINRF